MSTIHGYKVIRLLGEGSFGQVFEVEKDEQRFAMKITRGVLRTPSNYLFFKDG